MHRLVVATPAWPEGMVLHNSVALAPHLSGLSNGPAYRRIPSKILAGPLAANASEESSIFGTKILAAKVSSWVRSPASTSKTGMTLHDDPNPSCPASPPHDHELHRRLRGRSRRPLPRGSHRQVPRRYHRPLPRGSHSPLHRRYHRPLARESHSPLHRKY